MIKITILCVGRLKENYWKDACDEYSKRMKRYASFSIIEVDEEKLPDSPSDGQISITLKKEGERLLSKIRSGSMVAAMCIEGKQRSSEKLADMIEDARVRGISEIVFVIGGSWGLSEEVKNTADVKLSMSEMTFPHQLARVMLCEQLYRAFQICSGGKYHK